MKTKKRQGKGKSIPCVMRITNDDATRNDNKRNDVMEKKKMFKEKEKKQKKKEMVKKELRDSSINKVMNLSDPTT
jgi:hypothetical protein